MHLLVGEFAPAAPALPPLLILLVCAVALAICVGVQYFAKAFFGAASGTIGKLPIIGGWVDAGIHSVEQKITHALGGAVASLEARVGASWHQLARTVDWMAHEIASHAGLILQLAQLANPVAYLWAIEHALAHPLRMIHTLERAYHDTLRRIHDVGASIERGIGRDVLPRLRHDEQAIDRLVGKTIPALRREELALEHGAIHTWKWIRTHPQSLASAAFAGAVAFALARLGAGWVRCSNWRKIGGQVCATPSSEIDALLGLLLTAAALADYKDLIRIAQAEEKVAAEAIQAILKV